MEYPNLEQDFREIPESIVRSMAGSPTVWRNADCIIGCLPARKPPLRPAQS